MSVATDRDTATGDEAGTPPGDRKFRPDVQGMRAIAILLALVYHAGVPGFTGGYVGIEVFFVISGFVITGLLLREREGTGHTSLRSFYGRRARRIIPAASLVIVVTVIASYHYLGSLTGHQTAVDGQWAALFLANVHFEAIHTNYLVAQAPPSPLLNYWSLGVEEQFYIVYPTLFLLIGWWARKGSFRVRLTIVLVAVIVASYAYSIALTSTDAQNAYFSLFTRSWELALGALIAVHGRHLQRIPQAWAAVASWVGLTVILVASVTLTGSSVYPGALVAIPTLGAGLVIAGGAPAPKWGVERLLRRRTFQFLASISFPLYLWHWPILEIAAQSRGVVSLPVWDNIFLLLVAGVLATLTYYFFENPIRHSRFLTRRRWASLVMGLCLIAATLVVTTYEQHQPTVNLGSLASAKSGSDCPSPSASTVASLRSKDTSGRHQPKKPPAAERQTVLLIGDSTACTMLPGLQAVGPSYGLKFENGAVVGCGIVSGTLAPAYVYGVNLNASSDQCQGEADRAETIGIERYRPSLIVWESTDERSSVVASTPHGSQVLESGSAEWKAAMLQRINGRVEKFLATGARVILLAEPPSPHSLSGVDSTNLGALLKTPAARDGGPPNANDEQYEQMNALLREVAARHPQKVAVINLGARVCPSGPGCPYVVKAFDPTPATADQILRPDELHYLAPGSLWVAQWLVPRIAATAKGLS
jgi:peptidoglycan/LPS O-acetylase OafA/YrhL